MNKKILDILEFDKVKQLFEPYLQTEQGEMELAALTPTDKKESIETAFMELEDMEQILLEEPRFAVSTIQDVRPVAKRLEMEAALNIDELLALKAVLRVTHELKDFYDNLENVRLERLNRLFDNLVDLTSPTRWASSYQRRRLCRVFCQRKIGQNSSPNPGK